MPILIAGTASQLNRSTQVVLVSQQPCVPYQRPTCNRLVVPPPITPAPSYSFEIVNNANTTVLHMGDGVYAIEKTSGSAGTYDADAVSTNGIAGDFVLRLQPMSAGIALRYGGGVSASPTGSSNYTTVDNLYLASTANNWGIYESGANPASGSPGAVFYWIWRIGTALGYGRGDTLALAQASPDRTTTSTGTVFFDSTFADPGDRLEARFYISQDLVGSSSLSFAPAAAATGVGAVVGSSTLVFAPAASLTGKGALTGTSTIVFSPSATIIGKGDLSGSSSITFAPSATVTGKGALTGSSTIVFSPTATVTGKGALTGSAALVFSPAGTLLGKGALVAASSLVFAAAGTLGGRGALSGTSSLTFVTGSTISGVAALIGSSDFAFTTSGVLTGAGTLASAATLEFAAVGTLTGVAVIAPLAPRPFVIRLGDQGQSSAASRTYGEVSRRGYGSGSARASRSSGSRSYSSARGR